MDNNEVEVKEEVVEVVEENNHSSNHHEDNHNKKNQEGHSKSNEENENIWCGLAYLIFFLPLILIPNSKAGKYHANQGLILLILAILGNIVLSRILDIWILASLWGLSMFILFLIGLINGFRKEEKPLPIIGKLFTIIK